MKAISILFIYFLTLNLLHAQQDLNLPGEVVRQNSRVKTGQVEYLSNVNIQATQATPRFSDAKGQFTLVFDDKPVYNVTRIFATKNHMEVVNKTDLERAAVIGRLSKLRIIMCPVDELLENQLLYYGIAEESIVKRFKLRISRLEQANADLNALIAKVNEDFKLEVKTKNEAIYALEKEWSKALERARQVAEKFAAINLDDADQLYLQADAAFKKGEFERVLELLKYDLIDKNLLNIQSNLSAADNLTKEGQSKIAKGQENLRQTIQNALFGARVAKLNGSWKKAEDYYDLAVKGDETDLEVVFEAAVYSHEQNKFSKTRQYYENILQKTKSQLQRAVVLSNMAILLGNGEEAQGAKKSVEEALQIFKNLMQKEREDIFPFNISKTLCILGNLQKDDGDSNGAKKSFEEGLLIARKLADQNSDAFISQVAILLNNLAILLALDGDFYGAQKSYKEALVIQKKLAFKDKTYLPELASTLNNYGSLLRTTNSLSEAKSTYEETLQIYRDLTKKNPDAYLPDFAMILDNLGTLHSIMNNLNYAYQLYGEALLTRRKLAEKNPAQYQKDVAMTLDNMGVLMEKNQDFIGARNVHEEALQINRKLALKNPDGYQDDVAHSLRNLGLIWMTLNSLNPAEQALEESLQIYRNLAANNQGAYLAEVATTLTRLGGVQHKKNNFPGAKQAFEEVIKIRKQLAKTSPETYLPLVAETLNNLGVLLAEHKDIYESNRAYQEGIQIYRELIGKGISAYKPDLALSLNNLGALLSDNGYPSEAKQNYEESGLIYMELAKVNPQAYDLDVVQIEINICILYKRLLDKTFDASLKQTGLNLLNDALARLNNFSDSHPLVPEYRSYVQKLARFFQY
ncbi:MAG: tetratricopeptide repeat protein [Saprospiraceae bacterium]